jgi:hypothetical protein
MNFQLLKILPPTQKNKKYKAIVFYDNKKHSVHFGDIRYEQYYDKTPLKLYSHLNHGNKERRRLYLARHINDKGIAGVLAREYLW